MFCIENLLSHIKTVLVYKWQFKKIGFRSMIVNPIEIENAHNIVIGNRVYIGKYSWLYAGKEKGSIDIKDGSQIGHFFHIVALEKVVIERDVLVADKVFISDSSHNYMDVKKPVLYQDVLLLSHVSIGEGSWLGENVCVCGASIGKHCIIGANSVVTKDIPDYCVAVGSPAKVVKKYDFERNEWVKI